MIPVFFLLILLFVFIGGDSFDATQLLLVLALFSTLCRTRFTCRGNGADAAGSAEAVANLT